MKKILVAFAFLALSGCAWVSTKENVKPFNEQEKIDTSASFFMLYPENGHERGFFTGNLEKNEESAKEASDVFYKKFHRSFGSLTLGKEGMTLEQGLKEASLRGDAYLISMDITDWKDAFYMTCVGADKQGNTNENAFDSVDVSIQVYDVKTKKLLNKQRLTNAGCPVVFLGVIPIGTMGPKGRFDDTLAIWAENLK